MLPFSIQAMIQRPITPMENIYVSPRQQFVIKFTPPKNYSPENDDHRSWIVYHLSRTKRHTVKNLPANSPVSKTLTAKDPSTVVYRRPGYSNLIYFIQLIPDIKGR